MENPSPSRRHHRLAWLALATFGALLVLPATRSVVRTQLQMEALTYSPQTHPEAERAVGMRLSNDYPVQLALAAQYPPPVMGTASAELDGMARSQFRSRRLAALAERFPNNPSVYANLMRFMTQGEVRVQRDSEIWPPASGHSTSPTPTPPESLAMFEEAAQKGAQIDPNNAYFPMMQAISLFNAHRDAEALSALEATGRCSRWAEYYQDEAEGQNRIQSDAYGSDGALTQMTTAAEILFPQYAQLKAASRIALHLAVQKECAGNTEEALRIRHAVMRCGGLMRARGSSYITALVGIAIANLATSDSAPSVVSKNYYRLNTVDSGSGETIHLGHAYYIRSEGQDGWHITYQTIADPESLLYGTHSHEETSEHRQKRRAHYYAYLEALGHPEEAALAKTEMAACDQAKTIGTEATKVSLFDGERLYKLALAWLGNLTLLSGALILLYLGSAANLAAAVRPRKALLFWRSLYTLLILGGIGYWQWHAAQLGMNPYLELQNLFSTSGSGEEGQAVNILAVQGLTIGLSLVLPLLFVGLIAVISLFQKVPLATGLGRGLRGASLPVAAALFLLYTGSLLPTFYAEAAVKVDIAKTLDNEPQYLAESVHQTWPAAPQP